jgi:hypothetical protein
MGQTKDIGRGVHKQSEETKHMDSLNNRRLVTLDSVIEFGDNHPLTQPIARVTVLYGLIAGSATTMRTLGSTQVEGRSGVLSAVAETVILKEELLVDMRAINKIARALPVVDFPGVREQFRMPRNGSYAALANTARAFVLNATPLSQVFIDRGRPATFLDDLTAAVTAFEAARTRKQEGRHGQISSTAALEIAGRKGVAYMRELDAILSPIYEPDPLVFAAWKAAIRIERSPETEAQSATTPPAATPANTVV